MPTPDQIDAKRTPYIQEIGEVVFAWNAMHENLAELFWRVTGVRNAGIPLSIWHSTTSDRAQREMLRAVAPYTLRRRKRALEDVNWLLCKVDAVADRRNTAIHAPLFFAIDSTGSGEAGEMLPFAYNGNPRARRLINKDLLAEFRWYAETARKLGGFALFLSFHIHDRRRQPWPERPELPRLDQFRSHVK